MFNHIVQHACRDITGFVGYVITCFLPSINDIKLCMNTAFYWTIMSYIISVTRAGDFGYQLGFACRRCSNYIFVLNSTPGFNGLGKDNYKMTREAFEFWDLVRLIWETLWYVYMNRIIQTGPICTIHLTNSPLCTDFFQDIPILMA